MINEALIKLGLTEKEAQVYVAALPLGNALASSLGKRAKIPRTTAKFTCEQLVKKGFMHEVKRGNASVYYVEPPERILHLIDEERDELDRRESEAERVMADLKRLYNPGTVLPKVEYFTTKEQVIELYGSILDIVEGGGLLRAITNPVKDLKDGNADLAKIIEEFEKKRIKKRIFLKSIIQRAEIAQMYKENDEEDFSETRIADLPDLSSEAGEIFFVKDLVISVVIEKNIFFAYSVKNKGTASLSKALFDLAWISAKKLGG